MEAASSRPDASLAASRATRGLRPNELLGKDGGGAWGGGETSFEAMVRDLMLPPAGRGLAAAAAGRGHTATAAEASLPSTSVSLPRILAASPAGAAIRVDGIIGFPTKKRFA